MTARGAVADGGNERSRGGQTKSSVSYRLADFVFGTFLLARRASDSPIAMACLRLLTFAPERPLRSSPRFISCIAFLTFLPLALLYFRAIVNSGFYS